MFTPQQRKGLAGWAISPRDAQRTVAGLGALSTRSEKRKGVAIEGGLPKSPPPAASLGENGGASVDGGSGSELWQRFREAGLLDESTLEKRDREALVDRISKLERELHEYQYTMGLLLIEKKEWASKFEDLSQLLAEAEEMLKREQAAHLISISEVEKREENLRKALGVEKQHAADLEKSLREECAKSSDLVVSSDKKFAEAHASIMDIEDRKLEAERKLYAADAKMAEASRKNSEMERKLRELEARESFLHKERSSIKAEHEEQAVSLVKQSVDLQEWETKLQEGQERLLEGQGRLNYREKRINDKEMFLDEREKHLDDKHKTVLTASSTLEKLEDDINKRVTALAIEEEESAQKKQDLEVKEQELRALEKKLIERETMETQKLIVEHNAILNMKKLEFELEMDERRKSIEEELLHMQNAVKEKEDEINHKEEKVVNREQSVEKKMEKLREKERGYESNLKSLKEREKLVTDKKILTEAERKQIETEKCDLIQLKAELENDKAILIEKKQQILQEQDNLKVTEEERTQIISLQSKLKLEIDSYSHEKQSLLKEREDLKQERDNFEREWEVLDEKQVNNSKVLNEISMEKEQLERRKYEEEESLKGKKLEMECYIQRELESLRLKKKELEDSIEHDRLEMLEKAQKDRDDMLHSFDLHRHDLENSMQKRRENTEKLIQEKQRAFEEETQRELMHINSLKEQAQKSKEDLKLELQRLNRERQDMNESRKHIEQEQLEIRNDINELSLLSSNVSHQREIFMKERARFLNFVEEHRSCRDCGATVLPNLQSLLEIKDSGPVCLPGLVKGNSKYRRKDEIGTSDGDVSWFQKCTSRIFNISPGKKTKNSIPEDNRSPLERLHEDECVPGSSIGVMKSLERLHQDKGVPGSSLGLVNDSFGIEDGVRQMKIENTSFDEQSYAGQTQATSEAISTSHENVDPQPPSSVQSSKHRTGKKSRLRGTRSLKRVVEEAKAFLGEASGEPPQSIEGGNGDSHRMDGRNTLVGRKRQHAFAVGATASGQDFDGNDDRSDSVTAIGRSKRRQTVPPEPQTPVERRYNFRRSTMAGTPTRKSFPDWTEVKARKDQSSTALPENEVLKGGENSGRTILKPVDASPVACESDKDSCMLQEMILAERHAETEEFRANMDVNKTLICNIELCVQNDDQVAEIADDNQGSEGGVSCEEEEEEEETDNNGASIAKKVLRFFMT